MKTKLIQLLDYNIIVSDEEIKKGDIFTVNVAHNSRRPNYKLEVCNFIQPIEGAGDFINGNHHIWCKKLITSENPEHNLPNIDYNGFEDRLGVVQLSKEFNVEVEMERKTLYTYDGLDYRGDLEPKIINNKIKIINVL